MQNRYAGDVGDFGKFSLLRALFDGSNDKIGVIWYLIPDESHNDDGRHTAYLKKKEYVKCDEQLCEKMSQIVSGSRTVSTLESMCLLPANTVYFSELLDFHIKFFSQKKTDKDRREFGRKNWLDNAVESVSDCNVTFLDPDNGLQVKSCSKTSQMKAGKFAYYHEVKALSEKKDVCIIYHHLNRHKNHGTHSNQIQSRGSALRKLINPKGKIFAIRYKPYSPRAYFMITGKKRSSTVKDNIIEFMASPCGKQWDSFYEG